MSFLCFPAGAGGGGQGVQREQGDQGADTGGEGGGDWPADARLLKIETSQNTAALD